MAKEIKFGAEARAALETGVNKLADTDVYKRQVQHRLWLVVAEIPDQGRSHWHTEVYCFWMRCQSFPEEAWRFSDSHWRTR